MADTTKLAGTFKAWRFNIYVGATLHEVMKRCEELGLNPKVLSYNVAGGGIVLISVVVPFRADESTRTDSAFRAFEAEMKPFNVRFDGASKIDLICPPQPEVHPCEFGVKRGICVSCHQMVPLNGPVITSVTPLREVYLTRPHSSCSGGSEPEVGSIDK